jgi:hypothetical protein
MVVRVTFKTPDPSLSMPWHVDVLGAATETAAKTAVAKYISTFHKPPEFDMEIVPRM